MEESAFDILINKLKNYDLSSYTPAYNVRPVDMNEVEQHITKLEREISRIERCKESEPTALVGLYFNT